MLTEHAKDNRNHKERRTQDRRKVDFKFGSPEWIKHIKQNYHAWPKVDRRVSARRIFERRQLQENLKTLNRLDNYTSDLLTEEERIFFDQLFKHD
jgi:hypothetical protein